MEPLIRVSFLLLATVVFHLFSSPTVVEAREVNNGEASTATGTGSKKWCAPKNDVADADLQKNLDLACGHNDVDCAPIQKGGACTTPDSLRFRAAFAMNSYYRKHETELGSCDFSGTAEVIDKDPSAGDCKYI